VEAGLTRTLDTPVVASITVTALPVPAHFLLVGERRGVQVGVEVAASAHMLQSHRVTAAHWRADGNTRTAMRLSDLPQTIGVVVLCHRRHTLLSTARAIVDAV